MDYKVVSAMKVGEFTGQYGLSYKYAVQFEGQMDAVQLSQKPETPAPKAGDILSGTIEETKWGKQFRKESKGGGRYNDPQTRKEIIRQNALTNAVNFCVSKANLMDKKEAVKYLSGKKVIQAASYFAKYSEGEQTVAMTPEEVIALHGESPQGETQENETQETQTIETPRGEEIPLEDIPF